ncbi:hypothetical protein [Aliikangiella sp. G2MR2-5]|uniref:hypothetical protein n=1 Tax=Aliikangiella sp. G2MR2-5 TaxID=2788943 RepID=UPI0018A955F1|nr:hypothetical protein [Aliikangiella sp. G2MR2-5]
MKLLAVPILLFSSILIASENCELTEEYKAARTEAFMWIQGSESPFLKCESSVLEAVYWKAVAACVKEGKGKNIGGGCHHMVGHGQYPREDSDDSHCEIFRIEEPKKAMKELLEHYVKVRKIVKCKHSHSLKSNAKDSA